jgi:hypothetical protein
VLNPWPLGRENEELIVAEFTEWAELAEKTRKPGDVPYLFLDASTLCGAACRNATTTVFFVSPSLSANSANSGNSVTISSSASR